MVSPISMSELSALAPSFCARKMPNCISQQNVFSNSSRIIGENRPEIKYDLLSWQSELRKQKIMNEILELEKNGGSKIKILLKKVQLSSGMY